jgi:hypothetical protein
MRAWMLTKMMPSQRAQAALEMTPKPAASTMRPTIKCHQPHVAAPVLIQSWLVGRNKCPRLSELGLGKYRRFHR